MKDKTNYLLYISEVYLSHVSEIDRSTTKSLIEKLNRVLNDNVYTHLLNSSCKYNQYKKHKNKKFLLPVYIIESIKKLFLERLEII